VSSARLETAGYFWAIKHVSRMYGSFFSWTDRTGFQWRQHRAHWMAIGQKILWPLYQQEHPDVVIATHPFALNAWAQIKKKAPSLRVVGVLTDLSVHRFWIEPEADAYTVWLPDQVNDLVKYGIAPEKIWTTGIPIRAFFRDMPPMLPFSSQAAPIILLGGGLGLGPYAKILHRLKQLDYPVIAVCGQNERLRWQLTERNWPVHISIMGYVDNMPALLQKAHIVVGKPGGVTAAEVAQSQIPWVLTHWIPGQEEQNRDRLIQHHLALRGDKNFLHTVHTLLAVDSPQRKDLIQHQAQCARPHAAQEIAARIMKWE
ncbi:MAG: glycosyltransferase, partial [Firmicutes bacterium]|nr:glycosyltransferase [Bacillota bacterium]